MNNKELLTELNRQKIFKKLLYAYSPSKNLIVKILKTKIIYCTKCNKIFHWTEHYSVCPENGFKETDEILPTCHEKIGNVNVYVNNEYVKKGKLDLKKYFIMMKMEQKL